MGAKGSVWAIFVVNFTRVLSEGHFWGARGAQAYVSIFLPVSLTVSRAKLVEIGTIAH